VLIETVALVDAASLADDDSATIVAAIRKGRERLAEARTPPTRSRSPTKSG
jgi:hypothetical protein